MRIVWQPPLNKTGITSLRRFSFRPHYFELTQLPEKMEGVANVHLDALEHGDTIAFMHSVQDGAASKSYGLAVAALAGVPKEVIKRARQKLRVWLVSRLNVRQ